MKFTVSLVFILLGLVTTVLCLRSSICINPVIPMSLPEEYDSTSQFCCGGKVLQLSIHSKCCGDKEPYSSDQKVCCNGTVVDKTVSKTSKNWEQRFDKYGRDSIDLMCCGERLYPEEHGFCCDDTYVQMTEHQIESSDHMKCCGKTLYHEQEEMCCGTVYPKMENLRCCNRTKLYYDKFYRCLNGMRLLKTEGFCNGIRYDKMQHICCERKLTRNVAEIKLSNDRRIPNVYCCGSVPMKEDEKCCEEHRYGFKTHSIPKDNDLRCCGLDHYNITSQDCIGGKPIDLRYNHLMCGYKQINIQYQACCGKSIPYDKTTQQCCKGANFGVILKKDECCNGIAVKKNEICCGNIKPVRKQNENDDACCFDPRTGQGQTYNTGNRIVACIDGKLYHNPENKHKFCAYKSYNPDTHFCCSQRVYEHSKGQCCNGIFNNIPKEIGRCCINDLKAYKYGDESNPCIRECNGETKYDVSYELCCEGRVFNYTGRNYCCGQYAIQSPTKCCGDHSPYNLIGGRKECCWNAQLYDPRYSRCNLNNGKVESIGKLAGVSDVHRLCHPSSTRHFDGGIQHACMRTYGITGKIRRVTFPHSDTVAISLNSVRPIKKCGRVPRRLTFHIHMGSTGIGCRLDHLKTLRRVMIFFDNTPKGRIVEVMKDSPFIINKHTLLRRYSVEKALSTRICEIFSDRKV